MMNITEAILSKQYIDAKDLIETRLALISEQKLEEKKRSIGKTFCAEMDATGFRSRPDIEDRRERASTASNPVHTDPIDLAIKNSDPDTPNDRVAQGHADLKNTMNINRAAKNNRINEMKGKGDLEAIEKNHQSKQHDYKKNSPMRKYHGTSMYRAQRLIKLRDGKVPPENVDVNKQYSIEDGKRARQLRNTKDEKSQRNKK